MNELTLENIQEFIEQSAKANKEAWESQSAYFEGLIQRNTECFKGLGEARVASFKEMSEAQTFNQAFESNLAFEEKVREDLTALQEKNVKAWETMLDQLKTIYTPAESVKATKTAKNRKAA